MVLMFAIEITVCVLLKTCALPYLHHPVAYNKSMFAIMQYNSYKNTQKTHKIAKY